ncbi:MRG-domain-containing protein [Colletotrichum navitas]|uniref:Chromatin modification-related protein EAF3 n=1 Tax=Colletotrichum navitas TaxID=681940 RepID=A0AAD8Q653_9PEZI|nr:MRG-domain-containing protein [Colletotrichum navitas]KAK1596626.1 MRG-domain-containing protein [Colletotrichum navitas]
MAPARQPAQPFTKDEKVLCFHGEMLYEAKILDVQPADSGEGFQYRIHYKGWKNTWDDWVSIDRIRKFTEENKELASTLHAQMKDLRQKNSAKAPKKGLRVNGTDSARGSEERTSGVAANGRGPRRARDFDLEQTSLSSKSIPPTKMSTSYQDFDGLTGGIYENQLSGESYLGGDEEDAVHGTGSQDINGSGEPFVEDDDNEDIDWVAQVNPRCYRFVLTGLDDSPSAEEVERRYDAFLPQWNEMNWQTPLRGPLSPSLSPRTNIQSSQNRALSVISISSDESESSGLGVLDDLGSESSECSSSVELLGVSPIMPINDTSQYRDATPKDGPDCKGKERDSFEHHPISMQDLQDQKDVNLKKIKHMSAVVDSVEEPTRENEDGFHARPSIKLPIPDHIKAMLVDDWENITKNNQLVPLPHPHPVDEILNDYLNYERPNREDGSANMDILEEVVAGLREYFEKSLSRILLYRFERPQYHEVRKMWEKAAENDKHKSVCDTYGPEHLCRLMVSLPELVAQTNMDQQSVSRLREELSKLTVWLGKNAKSYFVSEYETPSQEYIDKARSF